MTDEERSTITSLARGGFAFCSPTTLKKMRAAFDDPVANFIRTPEFGFRLEVRHWMPDDKLMAEDATMIDWDFLTHADTSPG